MVYRYSPVSRFNNFYAPKMRQTWYVICLPADRLFIHR